MSMIGMIAYEHEGKLLLASNLLPDCEDQSQPQGKLSLHHPQVLQRLLQMSERVHVEPEHVQMTTTKHACTA